MVDREDLDLDETNYSMVSNYSYETNFTFKGTSDILGNSFVRVGFLLLCSFIFLVGFFGNSAVILVLSLQWKKRGVSKLCLWNMAVANFFVSIFCILQNLTWYLLDGRWIFGELMCKLCPVITNLCHAASILTVVVMSIERYVVVRHSLRCRQFLTTRTLVLIILAVWLLSARISLPYFFYFEIVGIRLNEAEDFVSICYKFQSGIPDAIYFLLLYLIPLVIMSTLYVRVYRFLKDTKRLRIELNEDTRLSPILYKKQQRLVRRLIVMVVSFAILNLPYHYLMVLYLIYRSLPSYGKVSDAFRLIVSLSYALTYANYALSPILYAFMSKTFRATLRELCFKGRRNINTV